VFARRRWHQENRASARRTIAALLASGAVSGRDSIALLPSPAPGDGSAYWRGVAQEVEAARGLVRRIATRATIAATAVAAVVAVVLCLLPVDGVVVAIAVTVSGTATGSLVTRGLLRARDRRRLRDAGSVAPRGEA
jgi:hypothetical protein